MARQNAKASIIDDRSTRRRPDESAAEWTVRNAYLRQSTTGTGKWYIHYTETDETAASGRRYRTARQSTFETEPDAARHALKQWGPAYIAGKASAQATAGTTSEPTFGQLVAHYQSGPKTRLSATNDRRATQVCRTLGDRIAATIGRSDLTDLRTRLEGQGYAANTVRSLLETTVAVLRYAVKTGKLPGYVVPSPDKPAKGGPRLHFLNAREEAEVFAAAKVWAQDNENAMKRHTGLFICIALGTGQRRNAILELTWDRIDMTTCRADFKSDRQPMPTNKKRGRHVQLRPRLMEVLRDAARRLPVDIRKGTPSGPVFTFRKIWDGFSAFVEAHDLPAWLTPHVCRHTYVTRLLSSGIAIQTLSNITGDSIATLQGTYGHADPDADDENVARAEALAEARALRATPERTLQNVVTQSADRSG